MDDLDPERIELELERLRNPPTPPSDQSLRRWVRIESLMEQISDLQHSLLLPKASEQEQEITSRLQALDTELQALLAEERRKGP